MALDIKKTTHRIYSIAEKYLLPLMLGVVVMNIIFSTYLQFNINLATLGFAVYEVALFALFEWLKPKKIFRGVVYIALSILLIILSVRLISTGENSYGVSFLDWFYVNTQEIGEVFPFFMFIFFGLGFFLVSIIYYFTIIRYRNFGTMLVILFPFVIYGKRADSISEFSITLMITIFLALMVHAKIVADDVKHDTIINSSYVIGAALFVTFVGAVTMLVPKPTIVSRLENNKNFFDWNIRSNTTSYDNMSDTSSPRFGADATGEILFNMTSTSDEQTIYLRRQSYDVFSNNAWRYVSDYSPYGMENFPDEIRDNVINSPLYTYNLSKTLAETGKYGDIGLDSSIFNDTLFTDTQVINEFSDNNFSPSYVPAPITVNSDSLTSATRYTHGEVFFNVDLAQLGTSFSYNVEGEDEINFAKSVSLDWNEYLELLGSAYLNDEITADDYTNSRSIYEHYTINSDYSEEMYNLAHEITDGYDNVYDKAEAIVEYFATNGFTYDIDYEPEDESIDYFLFTSKTGSCTSYATSMTMLARIIGLPTRYVEGFAAFEKNDDGEFVIRDSHAHAFVEVYIPCAGWMTFDPTVPQYQASYANGGDGAGETFRTFLDYFSKIVLFLGVIFVLVFIVFLDRIAECIFRTVLKFKNKKERSLMLYKRCIRLLEFSSKKRLKGCTPDEISAFAKEKYDTDIESVAHLFEQVCFGNYTPTDEELSKVYENYKASWKGISGKAKNKKEETA